MLTSATQQVGDYRGLHEALSQINNNKIILQIITATNTSLSVSPASSPLLWLMCTVVAYMPQSPWNFHKWWLSSSSCICGGTFGI